MARRYLKFRDGVAVDATVFGDAGIPADWPDATAHLESQHPIGSTLVGDEVIPPPPPEAPTPPTPTELAAQFDGIAGSMDRMELAFRAVVSLLADRMNVTDAQAKQAVKRRMQDIAEGARG